jgi:hypothetical protein
MKGAAKLRLAAPFIPPAFTGNRPRPMPRLRAQLHPASG